MRYTLPDFEMEIELTCHCRIGGIAFNLFLYENTHTKQITFQMALFFSSVWYSVIKSVIIRRDVLVITIFTILHNTAVRFFLKSFFLKCFTRYMTIGNAENNT